MPSAFRTMVATLDGQPPTPAKVSLGFVFPGFLEILGIVRVPNPDIFGIKQIVRVSAPDNFDVYQINRAIFYPAIIKVLQFDRV